jgi:hypothetical protein
MKPRLQGAYLVGVPGDATAERRCECAGKPLTTVAAERTARSQPDQRAAVDQTSPQPRQPVAVDRARAQRTFIEDVATDVHAAEETVTPVLHLTDASLGLHRRKPRERFAPRARGEDVVDGPLRVGPVQRRSDAPRQRERPLPRGSTVACGVPDDEPESVARAVFVVDIGVHGSVASDSCSPGADATQARGFGASAPPRRQPDDGEAATTVTDQTVNAA